VNYKMDFSKKGLDMFFKDWQLESLRVLWNSGEGLFFKRRVGTGQRAARPAYFSDIDNHFPKRRGRKRHLIGYKLAWEGWV